MSFDKSRKDAPAKEEREQSDTEEVVISINRCSKVVKGGRNFSFGALMRPASPGTGLIAGGAMRPVLNLGGVVDVLAKSLGSSNPANVVKATFRAIELLKTKDQVLEKLGKK